jgi:hypothetical protein
VTTAYDRIIDALRDTVEQVKDNGRQALANCPAPGHPDVHPSLGVTRIEGSVLVKCRSRDCHIDDILAGLGLTSRDLYDEPKGDRLATYTYGDGRLVHRLLPKPDGKKRFSQSGKTKGTGQLYHRDAVEKAVADGTVIFVVEGEKDVHAVEAVGAVATCSPMGAGKWGHVDPSPLRGAHVVVIPDRDEPGERHARDVVESLQPIAASVRVMLPKAGKDPADHVAAGHGLAELVPAELPDVADDEEGNGTWEPVDLQPILDGTHIQPEPTLGLTRSDGLRFVYPGKEHAVIGEMESGKSWWCAGCAAAELVAGHRVVYIHFEECDPTGTVEKLQAFAIGAATIRELFRFVGPNEPVRPDWLTALLDPPPTLVVLDGVNEAMSMHAMGIREEDGAAAFRRRLVKPCTATGAATLAADHVVKDREKRGRDPLGSIHKGNGLTGSLVLLENADPFGRGLRGRSHVFITKDRPGYLRRHGRATALPGKTFIGELVVDDTGFYGSEVKLWAPADKTPAEAEAEDAPAGQHEQDDASVLATVAQLEDDKKEPNIRNVRATVRAEAGPMSNDRIDDALARLVLSSELDEKSGARNARVFTTVPEANPSESAP